MKLKCYPIPNCPEIKMIPGTPEREWMDNHTLPKHPYRCLPMTIANTSGWELLCPFGFTIIWNGGNSISDTVIILDNPENRNFVSSIFANGIVTMRAGYLFQTEEGWDTYFMGPPNHPKHGITPLSGIVETSWLPFTSTMNWKVTTPGKVRFEKDEPFCLIMPIPHMAIEEFEPEVVPMESNPELHAAYTEFAASRIDFNRRKENADKEALSQIWQKHYFIGQKFDGEKVEGHVTKRRLKAPKVT